MGKRLIIKGADFLENAIVNPDLVQLTQSDILSGYDYYIASGGVATSNSTNYQGGFIDISSYDKDTVVIKCRSSADVARISFVTALPTANNQAIQFATGYSSSSPLFEVSSGNVGQTSIPSDAAYLYIMTHHSGLGGDIFPEYMYLR